MRKSELTGSKKLEVLASATGSYRLEVEPKLKKTPAVRYEIRIAELRLATEQDRSLHEARVLLDESFRLSRAGKYKDALPLAERALEIREKVLGSDDPAVAIILNRLGVFTSDLGDNANAETLYKRALNIYDKRLGPDDLRIADVLNNLAVLYKDTGKFVEADGLYQRVLSIREKALGPDHTLVAAVLNNMGILYRRRNDNARAQRMYERSLEIRERTLGPDHPDLARVLSSLSSLNYYRGDYATALKLDRRVLAINEKNLGPEHPEIADDLSNIALVYADSGEPEKAEPLYQRALEIYEKSFGRDHIESTRVLNNLAKLYFQQGDYAKAEPLFQRALQIAQRPSEGNDFNVAHYLNNLGGLYILKRDYAQAEIFLKRALEIREKILGGDHYDVGRTYHGLARLFALKGDVTQAVVFQVQANRIGEKNIALNLATGTEHQKLSYMSLSSEDLNQTVALHANMAQENAVAREQSVTTILQRKGRVLDAMTDSLKALRQRFDTQDQVLFDRLNDTNARLAELALNEPPHAALAEYQGQIVAVQEQKDKLETEISRRVRAFTERSKPVTLAAVQAVIPSDAALLEFAVYRPLNPKPMDGKTEFSEPRYVVYVIRNQGEVRWAELGAAKEVDGKVDAWRQALRDPRGKEAQRLGRAVDEKVMQPVRKWAGDASQLLFSPDGVLNLLPVAALVDEKGSYLIERYSINYLTSGRDLLRLQMARQSRNAPLVLADPVFGEPDGVQISKAEIPAKGRLMRDRLRQSVTTGSDLSEVYFARLEGTSQEAGAIRSLFPDSVVMTGTQATESTLKQAAAPRLVHIATHGFFLEANTPKAAAGSRSTRDQPQCEDRESAAALWTGAGRRQPAVGYW